MLSINVIHIREGMVHAKLHAYVRYRPRAPVVLKQKAPSSPRSHRGASEELLKRIKYKYSLAFGSAHPALECT